MHLFREIIMSQIKLVKLKNGSEEAEPLVRVTMMSLQHLMGENPIAFYELVELCKNRNHKMFGNTNEILERLSMVSNGFVHGSIRNIVLSAVKGEGLDMQLA